MQKPISAAETVPIRIVIVTLDTHLASAARRAELALQRELPGIVIGLHAASEFGDNEHALERCLADIARGDIIICTMMFVEDHIKMILPALTARREACDAMVCCMCSSEVMRLTRMGSFVMDGSQKGALAFLKRLRPKPKAGGTLSPGGAEQMAMLRRLPQILRYIPGTAQDVRAYFLTLQYWLAGSEENVANMVRALIDRYSNGERLSLRGRLKPKPPSEYPDVGVYHPRMPGRISARIEALPVGGGRGTVGLLVLRSYVLAGNAGHYDGVIAALEAKGLRVIPAFASGLDSRPAIEKFFMKNGRAAVDAVVSLTGFSLVGGPAYNDSAAAAETLATLDVPYIAAHPVEFQTLEQWGASERGLLPVESTIMVSIPELDGATGSMLFGGRSAATGESRDMRVCAERAEMLSRRIFRLIAMRRTERRERKLAIVLFNFPPNAGNTGTAAYLSVFESLFRVMTELARAGYSVEIPASVDALRDSIIKGNAERFGALANVAARVPVDTHVRREPWLRQIEAQWGPAPGKQQSDGHTLHILGAEFGNIFVGVQPAFGYEGDPMRLLFEKSFAPTHAFSAFYRYIREDFGAHAVLHFGTHGALEFMPGKQTALSAECWPDRLIGDLPNLYLYAANNPSEGMIAKRRSAATLISYLTPPVAHAGLYRGLIDLKASLERWRSLPPGMEAEREPLAQLLQAQAAELDLAAAEPAWHDAAAEIEGLAGAVLELEYTLIPHGMHIAGEPPSPAERVDMLIASASASHGIEPARASVEALVAGQPIEEALAAGAMEPTPANLDLFHALAATNRLLAEDHEIPALIHALDGGFVRPAPGGDLIRTPEILPTGRNLHGFDPFRIPSAFAVADGARQTKRLLARHMQDSGALPETVAIVLWGTDNLKTEGGSLAEVLAMIGARPRFDGYGRLTGAALVPLDELGRPRIDVVVTMSGIFRDLLPLQIKLLAEAFHLAAAADEPETQNFIRKHALAYMAAQGCSLETASLRVFGNADGAYGSNVNHLLDSGRWEDEDELAETYTQRKSFAYGRQGQPVRQGTLLQSVLKGVELTYQNLDSVELGVTTIDNYFDTLGGISRAVRRAKGGEVAPVYIGDQTRGEGKVRTLAEQVALETRTRMLNPKWYEALLKHGYEGVRQIESHVTNTVGWSATTGQVAPWVYSQLAQTYILDEEMRARLASLNPAASAKVANRLLEAHARNYWSPDPDTLASLRAAGEELEDRLEGIHTEAAA